MKLRSLHIARLPGIQPGFTLDGLAPGINVVVGPNASGKSSLLRALRATLYAEEEQRAGIHVQASFDDEDGEGTLTALRIGDNLQWQRDGRPVEPPLLPERRLLACYTLGVEDLLDANSSTDAAIADKLARELAGGYDLRAVRDAAPFRVKANHGRSEASELIRADQEMHKRARVDQELQRDADRLEQLRADKQQAETAGREAELHKRARELLAKRHQQAILARQLNEFPSGMDQLHGDEPERLATLRRQLHEQQSDRQRAAHKRAAAITALSTSGLDATTLDDGALADHRQNLDRLRRAETELTHKATEQARAEATLHAAIEALDGTPEQPLRLDPATIKQVEEQLAEKRRLDAVRSRLAEELDQLPAAATVETDPERPWAARRELLRWLSAPRTPPWTPLRIAVAGAVLGAAGAGIALAGYAIHWGLFGLLGAVVLGGGFLLRPGEGEDQRRQAQARFAETGHAPPTPWEPERALDRLEALDRAAVDAERTARARERRAEVERKLASRDNELRVVNERLRTTAAQVGHDPDALDKSLERWIRLTGDWDQARATAAAVRAEHQHLQAQADRLRAELLALLGAYGEAPATEQADVDTMAARLQRLEQRLYQRDQARSDIHQADVDIARLDQQIEATRSQIGQLFERIGLAPDDDDGLQRRIEQIEDWRRRHQEQRDLRGQEIDREQQIGDRRDLLALVDAADDDRLRAKENELRAQAEQFEGLVQEIERIEGEIARAGHERQLETARAQRQQAEERLRDCLDEALFAAAGRFLLERVESEHEQAVQPAALGRARDWFTRFTRHQFELVFGDDDDARFAARETASGEYRRLETLSSGTRTQLLLAVRVAFALNAERGRARLPLVLDEALTTADPERFRAVAESLTLLAKEDSRQVFYLTAQPDDARYWAAHDAAVTTIDLAAVRGREHAITDPAALAPAARDPVPDPNGRTPADYAVTLGVPPLDPWTDPGSIHAFYLLRDDLHGLQRLLELGVDRLGPLESLLASAAVDTALADDDQRRLRARAAGARAWSEAWRRGRGRPVDRAALEASGAVSATFLDRVADLNERLGGDGQALIERLAAGDVSRFQTDKREELETWLLDHGYITQQAPLSVVDIHLWVAAAMRGHLDADAEPIDAARQLVTSLEGGLPGPIHSQQRDPD